MVTIELTNAESEVLKSILERAADEFGNHICDDYPLPRTHEHIALWNKVQARNLRMSVSEMMEKLSSGDSYVRDRYYPPNETGDLYFGETQLMSYFAGLVEEESNGKRIPS